jgi:SPP1 family predicted phage head-tail adaptor
MEAGFYNKIIKIQKYDVFQNEYGEQKTEKSGSLTTRAKIVNLSALRESINNETFYNDTKQITIHDYVKINEYDHIIIDEKEYRIVNIVKYPEYKHFVINIEIIQD